MTRTSRSDPNRWADAALHAGDAIARLVHERVMRGDFNHRADAFPYLTHLHPDVRHQVEATFLETNEILQDLPWEPTENKMRNRNPNAAAHEAGKALFFLIWSPGHPNPPEQTFDTAAEAWDVAETMAAKNDGSRFFVLQAIGSACVEKPVTKRELLPGKVEP